jgi:hypothetical protein
MHMAVDAEVRAMLGWLDGALEHATRTDRLHS